MQVMEAAAQSQPSQPPCAELVALQFGLATHDEYVGFSVLEQRRKGQPRDELNSLKDPRLGIPAIDDICATCGGINYHECTGHFGHLELTQPIFHPNHMRLVQRILQKICLACGLPRLKKKKLFGEEAVNRKQKPQVNDLEDTNGEEEPPIVVEADLVENDANGRVILLSSDDEEELPRDILRVANGPMDFLVGSTSEPGIMAELPRLRSHKSKGKAHANGSSPAEAPKSSRKKFAGVKSRSTKDLGKIFKGTPAGMDVLNADVTQTTRSSRRPCKHCSPGYPDYRSILVKILFIKGKKKDDVAQSLVLEVQGADREDEFGLPNDFWKKITGADPLDDEPAVPKRHFLSASEALKILRKIPESAIGKLGMNGLVARPEGLVMKCVPVPPNCIRIAEHKYSNHTTKVRFGSDRVTRTLQNLLTEINRIHRTRGGKAVQRARRDESRALQILTAEYLREKGAPKAVPGKEPLKKDRNGRLTKQDDPRWTKDWLTQNILGKGGNFTARAVVVGDPLIGIEEIGVPLEIAQKWTMPERATQWNCSKLQEYLDRTQMLQGFGKPGVTKIVRNNQDYDVWAGSTHKVQIGDVVFRNIQDGDYVYVNRPPSVHKHSLIALKVRVQDGLVLTVNPMICPPLSGDFDGDIFHIYIPQSLQAIAELDQLMAVSQQIVSDHGERVILGLTQDTLLAAHMLTASKVLVDRALMEQLSMWSSEQPPQAAIVKSPKGGPFWTGEQVFSFTLPAGLIVGTPDDRIYIEGGQIIKWDDGSTMLRNGNDSIASALSVQLGPAALVNYLNTASGLMHAWLQVEGFSTGLADFQVAKSSTLRKIMLNSISEEYFEGAIRDSCHSLRILDVEVRGTDPVSPDILTKNVRVLEQAAQHAFRTRESIAEEIVLKYAAKNNSLLSMVKSGSKGSRGKLLQQVAGMGLQLYKGEHLLPFSGSRRPSMEISAVSDWWEDRGLVCSSLVDGLKATELFNHVIADRMVTLRKHVDVVQPGTLFKLLMLFLRDLHVMYDGSVRTQCGKNLVQFCYGGAVGVSRKMVSREGSPRNQFGMLLSTAPAGDKVTWEEDDLQRWPKSLLAGEPVGILAATAISHPAYELMLDAPNLNGSFQPRPLKLIQETLYPREKSDFKPYDRCVLIRLVNCQCTDKYCLERRILEVQAHLKRITLKTVAQSSAIEFWNMEDFGLAGPSGEELRLGSPWLGHIKLSLEKMNYHQVKAEDIVSRLRQKFSGTIKDPKRNPMGQIFFCYSRNCGISNGYCLHFSPRLPSKMQNQRNEDTYNAALQTLLMKVRGVMIPGLLESTVKGNEVLESVRIVSEGPSWTTWHDEFAHNQGLNEELILEILVSPTKSKSNRGVAWSSVKEACLEIMDMVDWNRSMPYSVQEIRHALGVEVAYQTVMRRLGLALSKTAPYTDPVHVKLIADMMTFSGDANGFTFSGFQDMNKSIGVSAPFTEAAVQKPIRTLLDAAGRGATDSVESVMASCVFGKEARLGTGSNFGLLWQPSKGPRRFATSKKLAEKDVHMILKELDEKCIPDKAIPPSPTHSLPGLSMLLGRDVDLDDGAGFSPQHASNSNDADDPWGSSPADNNGNDGAWGSSHPNKSGDDEGWGDSPVAKKDGGGWGAVGAASDGNGGWGAVGATRDDNGGWGAVGAATDGNGGWDEVNVNDRAMEQGEAVKSDEGGGWGSVTEKGVNNEEDGGWGGRVTETNTGNGDGWGSTVNGENRTNKDEDRQEDAEGGWGRGAAERSEEGGWGDVDDGSDEGRSQPNVNSETGTVPVQSGWDIASNDVAGTDGGNWSANPVKESGAGGWDSVSTEVVKDDGWDSMAVSQPESCRPGGSEYMDPRQGSGAENGLSQGRHFRARDEEDRGSVRSWSSRGGGKGRGRGGLERGPGSSRDTPVSGANVQPLGSRRGNTSWGDGGNAQQSSSWDDPTTKSSTSPHRGGDWNEPASDRPKALPKSPNQDAGTESAVEWGELVSGTTEVGGWDAISPENHDATINTIKPSGRNGDRNEPASDRHGSRPRNRDWSEPASDRRGGGGRGRYPSTRAMPRTFRQTEIEPECKEIDDIVKSMRQIFRNQNNETGGRLSDEDDEAVQAVLTYHPKYSEKVGCGIAYIKVDNSPDYPDVRCFWLVRTDGSETDFSYRKCLREKVRREFPSFVDKYDELYDRKRPPPINAAEKGPSADQAEEASTHAGPVHEIDTQLQETSIQAVLFEEPAPTTDAE
ncbi:hypothetical protein KC19_7G068200 [Ceratodon purpureus]|uniref:DNA-directed RNA polymerase subunit n=1 Tax=Ceratodon purpureus TaxID=3225 RepID=A0A8T0H3L6_CERPU|nr:hypothetical protein KC19_7G068200 [Ceratodon purpureus]